MKTNEPSYQNYLVKDGQAVPENPFYYIMGSNVATDYSKFETWKQSHTYATDAKDGSWPVERFEVPVWQYKPKYSRHWQDEVDEETHRDSLNRDFDTRQFAKFKEDVEKPKESTPDSFLKWCKRERIKFSIGMLHDFDWYGLKPEQRVIAENFMICFDQLLDKFKAAQPQHSYTVEDTNGQEGKPDIDALITKHACSEYTHVANEPQFDCEMVEFSRNDLLLLLKEYARQSQHSYTEADLKAAWQAGNDFGNECHCGECDYCIDVKYGEAQPFDVWLKTYPKQITPIYSTDEVLAIIEQVKVKCAEVCDKTSHPALAILQIDVKKILNKEINK